MDQINESEADVTNLIRHLDSKIIELRQHTHYSKLKPIIQKFYKNTVIPWCELTLDNQDITKAEEKIVTDKILDFINSLNGII